MTSSWIFRGAAPWVNVGALSGGSDSGLPSHAPTATLLLVMDGHQCPGLKPNRSATTFWTTSNRTVFIIPVCRLIRQADMIVMLHAGAVVEVGTHDELMTHRGRYYALTASRRVPETVVSELSALVKQGSVLGLVT